MVNSEKHIRQWAEALEWQVIAGPQRVLLQRKGLDGMNIKVYFGPSGSVIGAFLVQATEPGSVDPWHETRIEGGMPTVVKLMLDMSSGHGPTGAHTTVGP